MNIVVSTFTIYNLWIFHGNVFQKHTNFLRYIEFYISIYDIKIYGKYYIIL